MNSPWMSHSVQNVLHHRLILRAASVEQCSICADVVVFTKYLTRQVTLRYVNICVVAQVCFVAQVGIFSVNENNFKNQTPQVNKPR